MTTIFYSLIAIPIEVSFDQAGLNVGMTVSKWNGTTWVQVGGVTAAKASNTGPNTYASIFTPTDYGQYIVELDVYTDNTFTTLQNGYLPSSRAFGGDPVLQNNFSRISVYPIIGEVSESTIVGYVETPSVRGIVEC